MTRPDRRIRMVAVDLDGTLLTDRKEIGPRSAAALRAAAAAGVRVVLASARPACSARPYAASLGLDTPLVCYNGALVKERRGGVLLSRPLPAETVADLAAFCAAGRLYAKVFLDDLFVVALATEETPRYAAAYRVPYREAGDLSAWAGRERPEVFSFVIHARPEDLEGLRHRLEGRFAGRIACHCPNEHAIHVSAPEASKLAAVAFLARGRGIAPAEVLAIGDGANDLELIRWAGVGVAVANAAPELRAAADWVSAANDAEGVGLAMERYL